MEQIKNNNISFGNALYSLKNKQCKAIARKCWNGKGMFVLLAGDYSVPKDKLREGTLITSDFLKACGVEEMQILPHLDMWTADNKYLSGWSANQIDMLTNDWFLIHNIIEYVKNNKLN